MDATRLDCPMCDSTIAVYRSSSGALKIARHGSIADGECPASGQGVTERSMGCPSCGHDEHDGLTCHHIDATYPDDPSYCDCDKH